MEQPLVKKLVIPFVTTKISTDITLFFILLPIWMILGVTQFFGPILMVLLFLKLLVIHSKDNREIVLPFFLTTIIVIFLLSSLISGLHIKEKYWNLVFLRNLSVYLAALLLFLVTINSIKTKHDILKILWGLSIMAFIASVFGLFVILDVIPVKINIVTPISYILPENIKNSDFLNSILNPSFGNYIKFFNLKVKRISSIFPYPNMYAAVLIILLPFQIFLFKVSRKIKKKFIFLNSLLILINLFFTYSRSAFLALLFGFFGFAYLNRKRYHHSYKKVIYVALSIFIVLLSIIIISHYSEIILELKSGSTRTRMLIYSKTLESWKESPIFGFGTQRNMEVVGESSRVPPLGSHSTYLNLLYKYGLIGLILYLLIYVVVFKEIKRIVTPNNDDLFLRKFGMYAGWAFMGNAIQAIFIVMDFDVVVIFLIWINWAMIVATRMMLERKELYTDPLHRVDTFQR